MRRLQQLEHQPLAVTTRQSQLGAAVINVQLDPKHLPYYSSSVEAKAHCSVPAVGRLQGWGGSCRTGRRRDGNVAAQHMHLCAGQFVTDHVSFGH